MLPRGVPARKRRKRSEDVVDEAGAAIMATRPVRKGKTGKLAALTQMPLDILYEIFSYLHSPDVLKLSRTSKAFRQVLMSPSSNPIWKSARENVGLPECPPDMIEPQWANLAWSPHCHYCFTNSVRTIEWTFRTRICSRCAKDHLAEVLRLPLVHGVPGESLIPSRPSRRGRVVYVIAELQKVQQEVSTMSATELDVYVPRRREAVAEIMKLTERCEVWAQAQNNGRALELEQLREERRNAIVQKLKALGWGKDLESIKLPDSLGDHKLVRVPQRLTERVWGNIQGRILQFMTEMRKKRIEREQKEIIMRRKRIAMSVLQEYKNGQLPYQEVMPEAVDFCAMEPVKAIIDQPLDVSIDVASFSHIIPELPQLFDTWRDGIRLQLSSLLEAPSEPSLFFDDDSDVASSGCGSRKYPVSDDEALEMLNLASTIFVCRECGPSLFTFLDMSLHRPIFYPEVLGHTCLTRKYSYAVIHSEPTDPSVELNTSSLKRAIWNTGPLMLSNRLRHIAEELIIISELDPECATTTNMDEQKLFYACVACSELHFTGEVVAPVYRWRDAICHQAGVHDMFDSYWHVANQEDFEENRLEMEDDDDPDDDDDEAMYPIWCCTRCRDTPQERGPISLPSMTDHYLFQHEFYGSLVLNQEYYRSSDAHKREYSSPPKMFIPSSCHVIGSSQF